MKGVVTLYNDPDLYPPTLNAVLELSKYSDHVFLVTRHFRESEWDYPSNATRINVHPKISMEDMYKQSTLKKFQYFWKYLKTLRKVIIKNRPEFVLCYDVIPAFAFWLIRFTLKEKPKYWYHNHDVIKMEDVRKFSVQWWAGYFESVYFKQLDIFSLPSREREQFFNMDTLKGQYLFLPNFPRSEFYTPFQRPDFYPENEIRIIYQGTLNAHHGIESIIPLLNEKVNGKKLFLSLIGFIKDPFKESLLKLAAEHKVSDRFEVLPTVDYEQLPGVTAAQHIGVATHLPHGENYSTGGTASNKIYEYSALGLPVLLYDSPHYRELLAQYNWAFFTDLSKEKTLEAIRQIDANYPALKKAALKSFSEQHNFEASFKKAILCLAPEKAVQN